MFLKTIYTPSIFPSDPVMDHQFLLSFFILFCIFMPNLHAQQSYSGNSVRNCDVSDEKVPSSAFLYTCNGENPSCQSFLIFKSQTPYDSVSTISNLTSADPLELADINNISISTILPPNKEVIVPVNCSCSGQYYQAKTSYIIPSMQETYFSIANNTYQGLSTCKSLMQENSASSFHAGLVLQVPLRCACPTSNQALNGTKFLLTYVVDWGDTVYNISNRFNASMRSVADANGIDLDHAIIFPFTTILVPLSTKPSSLQTIIHFPTPPYSSPSTPINLNKRKRFSVWIGIGIGISLLVLCFFLLVVFLHHKKKTREATRKDKLGRKKWELPKDFLVTIDRSLKIYDFEDIEAATENFSHNYKMGGSVYRGVLNGELLAIKQMSKDVNKEVCLLKRINHFNLISLRGACEHSGVFYLVYEFMENGCLKEWLQKKSCQKFQIWKYRIQIALDVANGLHYLHNFTTPAYVHKDICSDNVLLDGDLRAKIANLSLARSAEIIEESKKSSMWSSLGTKGYIAPEFMEYGLVTPEIDIYAFGVILLELITGKEAVFTQDGKEVLLSEAVLTIMKGKNAEAEFDRLIDPSLKGHLWMELAYRMLKLSIECLAEEPESRLSMAEIVSFLLRIQQDAERSG